MRYDSFNKNNLMKSNLSYEEAAPVLFRETKDIANNSLDFEITGPKHNKLEVKAPYKMSFKLGRDSYEFGMTEHSASQLSTRAGMPAYFFNKLAMSRDKGLSAMGYSTLNALLARSNDRLLLRTCGDKLRGVVSSKYSVFDAVDILSVLDSSIRSEQLWSTDNLAVMGYYNDMELFHMRVVDKEPVKGLSDKDMYFGFQITSSDVGKGSIRISFFIYKQWCTNGMCSSVFDNDMYCQRHLAVNKDYVTRSLRQCFRRFPRIAAEARESIIRSEKLGLSQSPLFMVLDPGCKDVLRYREKMKNYLGVGLEDMNILAELADRHYNRTLWGYCNAVTEYAQRYRVERRLELERLAGNLMSDTKLEYLYVA